MLFFEKRFAVRSAAHLLAIRRPRCTLLVLWLLAIAGGASRAAPLEPGDFVVALPAAGEIVRISAEGGTPVTLASSGLMNPIDVAIDGLGRVIVADFGAPAIIRVDPADDSQEILASGLPLIAPESIAIEASGAVVVVDPAAGLVLRVGPDAGVPPVVIADTGAGSLLGSPLAVHVIDDGTILIGDAELPSLSQYGVVAIDPVSFDQSVITAATILPTGDVLHLGIAIDGDDRLVMALTEDLGMSPSTTVFRFSESTGAPELFPPLASLAPSNGLARDAAGSLVVTIPLTGLARIEPGGTLESLASLLGGFGIAVAPAPPAVPALPGGTGILILSLLLVGQRWQARRSRDAPRGEPEEGRL